MDVYITHKDRTLGKYEEIKNKALEREVNKIISETNIFEEKPKEEKEKCSCKRESSCKRKRKKKSYNVSYKKMKMYSMAEISLMKKLYLSER